jgi:glycosyltransferase involved in cell wall biosynthesis
VYTEYPFLSIIIPVYNGDYPFICCLLSIKQSKLKNWELIVVDDGSNDLSAVIAEELGATVLNTGGRLGPGGARNMGAQIAKGEYLCFIDADCEVNSSTFANLVHTLKSHPKMDAVFGSYDDAPKAPNFIAQYKNLFHHYVHQHSSEEASTFWAGCGVVRRSMFLAIGGFDVQRYPRPSIEDVDLGYRIKQAGGKIYLAKHVQVKHHKAWTLLGLIKTDVLDRGIPWTQLILSNKSCLINDLNLQNRDRVSVVATYCLIFFLLASIYKIEAVFVVLAILTLMLFINWNIYRFFSQKRGIKFVIPVIIMHWLYYFYSGISFITGTLIYWQKVFYKEISAPSKTYEDSNNHEKKYRFPC